MGDGKLSIGDVEVISLTDVEVNYPIPLSQVFPDVPAADWAPYREQYPEMFGGSDHYRGNYRSYLLRSQGRTILVDTGAGQGPTQPEIMGWLGNIEGLLMTKLHQAGVRPEDIDVVFLTHLHPVHVGWNLTKEPDGTLRPTFPNARYLINEADWESFGSPETQAEMPIKHWGDTLGPLETLGVLDLISGDEKLTNEITAFHTPGHTPGHMSLSVVSGSHRGFITGDVAIHPALLVENCWQHMFQMDHDKASAVRKELFDRAEAEDAVLAVCHFPTPGFGKVETIDGRRQWQSIEL